MPFSTEVRVNRAFAAEIKFFVNADRIEALRSWARARLGPDPYGGGPNGDTYKTNSLYFDTPEFDVYHRRGSYGRSKYRVRRYGHSTELFFERKLKTRDLVSKRRSIVDERDLPRLANPEPAKGWPGHWFHRRILARDLDVVCQVAYTRTALVHSNGDGPIRLTLDEQVVAQMILPSSQVERASARVRPAFQDLSGGPRIAEGSAVLELKFYQALPAVFQQLISEFALIQEPISKYRMSIAALHLGQAAQSQEVTI